MAVPPSVWIRYQLVGAYDGQQITLECHSEAYPKSINYWTRDNGEIIPHSELLVAKCLEVLSGLVRVMLHYIKRVTVPIQCFINRIYLFY